MLIREDYLAKSKRTQSPRQISPRFYDDRRVVIAVHHFMTFAQ